MIAFFGLTFLLSIPFYILNALAYLNVVGKPEMGALYIGLFTVTPLASASILTFRSLGSKGVKELLRRIFDFKRITKKRWYIAIILLSPLIFLFSLTLIVLLGFPVPPTLIPFVALPVVFLFFFLLATGEEVGWMGYAFESMQKRNNALRASLMLGLVWAFWHLPFFIFMMPDPFVLTSQFFATIGFRVLIAWIFNNTGKSVFATISFHAMDNTALLVFPEIKAIIPWGSIILCGLIIITVIVVSILWGTRSLARYRGNNIFNAQTSGNVPEPKPVSRFYMRKSI
jgi:membrane protease YdiL (CAAX protease family)